MSANWRPTTRRRLLRGAVLLPATLTFSVSGCGTFGVPELATADRPSATPSTLEAPASSAPFEAARSQATELTIRWNGLDPGGQAAALDFAAHLWDDVAISVIPDFTDWASSFQKISRELGSGSAPDIWQAGGLWTSVLAAKGVTLGLDEFVDGWAEWPDFYPAAVDDVTYQDQVHGVPYRVNLRSPVIRPSMFEAAGLEPNVPTTWEELNEVAPQLTISQDGRYEQAGFNQFGGSQDWDLWLQQAGPLLESDKNRPTIDRDSVRAALEQTVYISSAAVMPRDGMESGVPNLHAFCAGRVAIQRLWPGDLANCEFNAPDVFEDSMVGEPWVGPSGQKVVQMFIDKYMGYKLTKSPESVYTVFERLSDLDVNLAINVESLRSMPCRVAMESHAIYGVSPWREFANNIQYAPSQATVDEHFRQLGVLGPWFDRAAGGEISIDEALSAIEAGLSPTAAD